MKIKIGEPIQLDNQESIVIKSKIATGVYEVVTNIPSKDGYTVKWKSEELTHAQLKGRLKLKSSQKLTIFL